MVELLLLLKKSTLYAYTILVLAPHVKPAKAAEFGVCVAKAENHFKVDPTEIIAVINKESRWREKTLGRTADYGLGQIHCPGPWCDRKPTKAQLKRLMTGCSNIQIVGEFLHRFGIRRYNPGSSKHMANVHRYQRKIRIIWKGVGVGKVSRRSKMTLR